MQRWARRCACAPSINRLYCAGLPPGLYGAVNVGTSRHKSSLIGRHERSSFQRTCAGNGDSSLEAPDFRYCAHAWGSMFMPAGPSRTNTP